MNSSCRTVGGMHEVSQGARAGKGWTTCCSFVEWLRMSCSPSWYICLLSLLVSGLHQSSEESLMYITKVFKNMLVYFSLCYIQHSGCWLEWPNQVADRKVKRWSDPDLPVLSGASTSLLGTTAASGAASGTTRRDGQRLLCRVHQVICHEKMTITGWRNERNGQSPNTTTCSAARH